MKAGSLTPVDPPRSVAVIAAVAANGVIGLSGGVPWHLPADLQRFRRVTSGHTVIMGRKTWATLKAPLIDRENIVMTRQADFNPQGARVARSLDSAIRMASYPEPIFVIGGERLYADAMEIAQQLYLTELKRPFLGDVFFPQFDRSLWSELVREEHVAHDPEELRFDFVHFCRCFSPLPISARR